MKNFCFISKLVHRALGFGATIALVACATPPVPVVIDRAGSPVTGHLVLANYASFHLMVAEERSFIVTVTNRLCSCTVEFLPLYDQYLTAMTIGGYTIEYSHLLYETEKHGLPVVDSNSPILAIYEFGILKYERAYEVGNAKANLMFTTYEGLVDYLGARIDVPDA